MLLRRDNPIGVSVQGFGVWVVWADSEEFRHDQKAQYAIVPQS